MKLGQFLEMCLNPAEVEIYTSTDQHISSGLECPAQYLGYYIQKVWICGNRIGVRISY